MSITVTIDGVDRTSSVKYNSVRATNNLNQQVDSCTFRVKKYGSLTYTPTLGHTVSIMNGTTPVFGGVILRINESLVSAKIIEYEVECADYSQYLKRKLVTGRYENQTVAAIIDDLVASYTTPGDGITSANANSTLVIESISFNRLSVADCLQKLADAINYVWYVDYSKDIHFFPSNTELAPFNLTDSSNNYIYDSLEITEDLSQIRNSILVQGGEAISPTSRTEEFDADGTKDIFRLANKFDKLPTVTVGGVPQTVGVEYLYDDASFDCMWNYNEKYVRFTAGNIPAAGTRNVDVSGTYLYPIVVRVPSPASMLAYGTYEFAVTDKSIRSQAEAIARATAELTSYKNSIYEGEFRTYTDGLRAGQVININSTQRGRNINVLIQSVSTVMRDPLGNQFEYTVKFATLKSIGIIEYLQNQLRSKEVIVDDQEQILTFTDLSDTITSTDSVATPVKSSGPYVWAYLDNQKFDRQPPYAADTSTFARWIDGTAGGSTTDNRFAWAISNTTSGAGAARFTTTAGKPCIRLVATNINVSGGQVVIAPISSYTGPTLSLSTLNSATPVVAGQTYNFSAEYYIESVTNTSRVQGQLLVVWYDAAGNRLTTPVANINNTILNTWTTVSLTGQVAPVGAAFAVVTVRVVATGAVSNDGMTVNYANVVMSQTGKTNMRWGYSVWG